MKLTRCGRGRLTLPALGGLIFTTVFPIGLVLMAFPATEVLGGLMLLGGCFAICVMIVYDILTNDIWRG